jgi:hypothetical protein
LGLSIPIPKALVQTTTLVVPFIQLSCVLSLISGERPAWYGAAIIPLLFRKVEIFSVFFLLLT